MNKKFPDNFIFGAATAAYQVEGETTKDQKLPNYWDKYYDRPESTYNAKIASDFYNKYPDDLKMAKDIGINGIRISLAWTRLMDINNKVNLKGVEYYHKLINECISNGIEPYVTLHHFDTPLHLHEKGDWLNRITIEKFVEFASFCFDEFKQVNKWISINEPFSVAAGQYIIGHFPPNIKYNLAKAIKAIHNMNIAHVKIVKLFKEKNIKGEIGVVHILEGKYPITQNIEDKKAANNWDAFCNKLPLDEIFLGSLTNETKKTLNYILEPYGQDYDKDILHKGDSELLNSQKGFTDFIGINYYASHHIKSYTGPSKIHHNHSGEKGSAIYKLQNIGEMVDNPNVPKTDWDWPIFPEGLYNILLRLKETYNVKKTYITENGLGDKDKLIDNKVKDDKRIEYVSLHLEAILKAIENGVNVQGYFMWSLMDLFSWTNGYTKRYGFIYVDFETQKRFVKKSGNWWKKISSKHELI